MSGVGDSTNQEIEKNLPQKSKSSGNGSSSSRVDGHASKKLKFDSYGQPIGEKSHGCSTTLGELARTHVPIFFSTWKHVTPAYKDLIWAAFKKAFPDIKESQKRFTMKKACDAWKKYKYELRKTLKGNDPIKWKDCVPELVKSEDWEIFCDHEATTAQGLLRIRNKSNKAKAGKKITHRTGRDGYARAAYKFEEKNGHPPSRAELWLATHRLKDGSFSTQDKENAESLEMLLMLSQEKGEEESIDSDPINKTFGKETRGRVQCIGSTVSARAVMSSQFAREMLVEVKNEQGEWAGRIDQLRFELKAEIEGVKATLELLTSGLVNNIRAGNFGIGTENSQPVCAQTSEAAGAPTSNLDTPSTDVTLCEIQGLTGEIVAYGRKNSIGSVSMVHGHTLRMREVRVLIDRILVPEYPLCGGNQGSCKTFADVGEGAFIYWHDDYLPPRCDNQQ